MTSSSSSSPEITAASSAEPQELRFSYKRATHDEVLEDLSSRFILNLPEEELASLERICFQVEQAHWFYEDFIREQNPNFPSLPLKKFSAMLFHACPLLHQWSHDHEQAFNTFMQYKTRVPVCGAIMLNDTWEKCLLVKGWKSSSGWGFPKGKINEDEPPPTCAIREVLEETGYNLAGKINPTDVIEMSIREQKISLFIVPGIPEDFPFKTKTRKEISKIEWFKLTDLPTWKRNKAAPGKFYLISPFIGALKAFINERKPRGIRKKAKTPPYRSPNESAQDSSSQSSSADNGEPQTPSPQYPTAAVNNDPHVMDAESSGLDLPVEAIDPHFARLLSSLTLSASTSAKDVGDDRWQNSPADLGLSASVSTSPGIRSPGSSIEISQAVSDVRTNRSEKLSPPSISPITTSRSATSRRTSSIADISPYLVRPVEVPTSATKLRQLALLESVADESARLASSLTHHNTVPSTGVCAGHPSPSSFPVSPIRSETTRRHVLYSSNPTALRDGTPSMGVMGTSSTAKCNSIQARPWTSSVPYHDLTQTPPTARSLSRPRSPDSANGSRNTPVPYMTFSHPLGFTHAPGIPSTQNHISTLQQMQVGPLPVSMNSLQTSRQAVMPTSTIASRVAATPVLNPSASSLLSILCNRPSQGSSTAYAGSPFNHGRH
ncbi:hypothetical protein AX17_000285 [Amanita inopinata Kibby_2008]|nr:hypothetical protein AX17_000285 [Amanita inopinata Kibby_2008]